MPTEAQAHLRSHPANTASALLAATILVCAPSSRARPGHRAPLDRAPDRPNVFKLPNGLTIVSHRDKDLPLVTIEVAVKNGSFTEPPDMNGLSHLYEHMFFKGNGADSRQENTLKRLRSLGALFNATTSEEVVTYFLTLSSSRLAQGMAFMRDALLTPRFDKAELAKERRVVLAEYDRAEANPSWALRRAVDRALWYRYWSRKNPIGSRFVVAHATVDQMRRIQRLYYQPSNTAIIVSGDLSPSRTRDLAAKLFGSWRGHPVQLPTVEHPDLPKSKVLFVERPVKTVTILLAFQGPSLEADRQATYAADVLTYALNQRAGAFQRRMVRSGLALNMSAMYLTRRSKGPIYIQLETSPDKALAALKVLFSVLADLASPGLVTDAEIAAAKRLLAVQDIYDREAPTSYAHLLAHWWATADLNYYVTYIARLSAVTRADLRSFVTRYIAGKPMVVGLLSSRRAAIEAGLTPQAIDVLLPAPTPAQYSRTDIGSPTMPHKPGGGPDTKNLGGRGHRTQQRGAQ